VFILKKIIQPLILPPGCLIVIVLIGAAWMLRRKRRACGLGFLSLAVLMWCLGLQPVADQLFHGLEQHYRVPQSPQGDVIVMLGGAVYGRAADMTGQGAPTPESCERILTTARLYRRMAMPIILSGGRVLDHHPLMGPIYKRMLVDLGVPAEMITLESRSRDTLENARFTAELCRQRQFKRAIVITHAAHMPRVVYSFKQTGLPVTPFPCGFRTWPEKSYHWPDFLPRGYRDLATALHEHFGLWYYRWMVDAPGDFHRGRGN